jgi:hypothetical protein
MLAESTNNLGIQLNTMNETFHTKMDKMAAAINNLDTYSNRRHPKSQKSSDTPAMDLDL